MAAIARAVTVSGSAANDPESLNQANCSANDSLLVMDAGNSGSIGVIDRRKSSSEKSFVTPATSAWLPEFLAMKTRGVQWLIEPFLPKGGTVLLHGPKSTGKSPLTWAIATSVSEEGADLFG